MSGRAAQDLRSVVVYPALFVTFILLALVPAAAQALTFDGPTDYPAGVNPNELAVGDFDADGTPDLAVTNNGPTNVFDSDVSVLLGDGTGAFDPQTLYPVGTNPYTVAVGDFNGDDRQDLVTANPSSQDVSVLLGDGTGGFAPEARYRAGDFPYSVATGDLDGDADADLAVVDFSRDEVGVMLGDGHGAFAAPTKFSVGKQPRSVAVGNFDQMGGLDLAVASGYSHNVSVLLGNGNGSFGAQTTYAVGGRVPEHVAVADLNSDGHDDLVTANQGDSLDPDPNDVSVLLGNGSGGFAPQTSYAAGDASYSVAVADFNADSDRDLAVANLRSDDVSILLGSGNGSFGQATTYAAGDGAKSVGVGDFDHNDLPDVAVANNGSQNEISVLINAGPDAPGVTGSEPLGPANNNSPRVKGSAEADTTVKLYATPDCSGPPLASGSPAEFAFPGITVPVADNSSTSFHAVAVYAIGSPSECSNSSATYVEDSSPPNTTITSGPSGPINSASPSFNFTASQANSSFECRLDSTQASAWQSCSSPKSYSNLANGSHTFEVRAIDPAGNADPTPARRKFSVDTVSPNTTITSGPSGPINSASPSFNFTASQANSSFECRLDSTQASAWQSCSSPKSYSNLANGSHTFEVRAIDPAGNADPTPARRKFRVSVSG